jgi:hypothetical protein
MFYIKFYQELYGSVTAQQVHDGQRQKCVDTFRSTKIKLHLSILSICHEIQETEKSTMLIYNENNLHLFSHSNNCRLTTICCTI